MWSNLGGGNYSSLIQDALLYLERTIIDTFEDDDEYWIVDDAGFPFWFPVSLNSLIFKSSYIFIQNNQFVE